MKKLCIANYVYGKKYQDFIPMYIMSVAENYPEYDIRIYIDSKLGELVAKSIGFLSKKYNNFTIIENYAQKSKLTKKARSIQPIQRSQRWLIFDEVFMNYQAIYIGDIDIFMCREEKPLFEQHMLHCSICGSPYSNILRKNIVNCHTPRMLIRNFVKAGVSQMLKYYLSNQKEIVRLSGLHFVQTKEYYNKINEVVDNFYEELNRLAEGKSKKYNLCSFNDETLLRDLVLAAGFQDAYLCTNELYNIETDATKKSYRPHHGIHLGIFRSQDSIKKEERNISSSIYCNYYKQFCKIRNTDIYQYIYENSSEYLKNIIESLDAYYNRLETAKGK